MTKQQEVAQFLDQYATALPRCQYWFGEYREQWTIGPRPSAQEVAQELLKSAEFRALQLGTWLNTTDGEVIAEAVEMVAPPFYRQDIELLVEALQLAAAMQQTEGRGKAGLVALGVAALVFSSGGARVA